MCFCFIIKHYGLRASASACCILSFEVIRDTKDPLVMVPDVENAFSHLRRQLLLLFLVLLAAQAAQKASPTQLLTEEAAAHGMHSSLNTPWAAASPNLLDVQELGIRISFHKEHAKMAGF